MARSCLIDNAQSAVDYLRLRLSSRSREEIWALFLDARGRLLRDERLSAGTINQAPLYVREIIGRAIELGASRIVLAHNHPSGDLTPSPADIEVTLLLANVGRLLGIRLLDHLIVSSAGVSSLRQLGHL
ncbi:JAB domain-containing protein [Sphingomonas sp.]|uniref:JAB domain-containing protein n=1 Tax=Sphingomonas sp. TaxID=28214 RepID=UPI003FA79BDC